MAQDTKQETLQILVVFVNESFEQFSLSCRWLHGFCYISASLVKQQEIHTTHFDKTPPPLSLLINNLLHQCCRRKEALEHILICCLRLHYVQRDKNFNTIPSQHSTKHITELNKRPNTHMTGKLTNRYRI